MPLSLTITLLSFLSGALSAPAPDYVQSKLPLPAYTVAQLPTSPTWLENIAVRANGDLLVTQFDPTPALLKVCNPSSEKKEFEVVHEFQNITKVLGIVETLPDTFIIVGGNATANATGYAGTYSSWEVTFSESATNVRKIVDMPEAMFLNGVAALPKSPNVVLIADSQFGLLFRLDAKSKKYEIIADRPEFKPHPERYNKTVGFGINGVKIRDGYLYFSNSDLANMYRVPITKDGYIAQDGKAPIELYADLNSVTTFIDDFEISKDGTLWIVTNSDNTVITVSPNGRNIQVVAGAKDQLTVAGGTGVAFGRTKKDKHVLYVSTAGGLAAPVNGTVTEPGKVEGINTQGW